jgi:tetratricopeptide (TPR) repeat protein/predicted Ser/Thr protein kinase
MFFGTPPPPLERGTRLAAGRYEILDMLGQGGMGAVYKAKDYEVDRVVAIKIIQPELAKSSSILKRFKQELLLAREVTHKNVVRIFDIGESEGLKFITMEYIDGGDLKSYILERGKVPPQEAVHIIRQICHALDAAHSAGVVHRDLKPQNIMIDQDHRVVVMDFGIAHSKNMPGMTATGALMGTPDYMSPEQAKAQRVDARSDIFSLGLIFYEMLVGQVPFHASTVVETMFKRTHERAVPPAELEHSVPLQANKVVMQCLETDPANRYQSIQELLGDLETFDAAKKVSTVERMRFQLRRKTIPWKGIAVAALAAVLLVFLLRDRTTTVPPVQEPRQVMQVLIADFASSDPDLSGALEPILGLALEGASFISNVDRAGARATGKQLSSDATAFDENVALLVAARDGIDVVLSGSVTARGNGYSISVKAVEAATGKTLATAAANAAGKDAIPVALTELAASLRASLGDTESDEVKAAQAETISTSSLEALRSYAQAQEFRSGGDWESAIRNYTRALQLDPNLGRAYSGIAAAYNNRNDTAQAEKYYQLAMTQLERMTEREKYRTRGGYYLFARSTDKAIDEYKQLVAKFPGDTAGYGALALAYFQQRNITEALLQGREFLKIYPKNVTGINNVALYAMYAGDFEAAKNDAARVLQLNPSFAKAYLAGAMAELAQGRPAEAAAIYEKAKAVSTTGASLAAAGLADIALYEGRLNDAIALLESGSAADVAAGAMPAAADKLATLATVYADLNNAKSAIATADRAIAASQYDSVLFRAASAYIQAGERFKAVSLIDKLAAKLQNDPRAYAKLLEAAMLRKQGNPREAVSKARDARELADSWLAHLELGRAYLEYGAFTEASSEFDHTLKRRGEATAVFLDDRPTYHLFPQVLYYQARVQEGLKSPGAVDQYKAFLSLKGKSQNDPLALDARKRAN